MVAVVFFVGVPQVLQDLLLAVLSAFWVGFHFLEVELYQSVEYDLFVRQFRDFPD